MRIDRYIGLFRALPRGKWRVTFPDLPGCVAEGGSFKEVFERARRALTDHLAELDDLDEPRPRPRSTAELMIDGQRDWMLCREFVDAVMHPVDPLPAVEMAPIDLVAASRGVTDPQVGI